jgi:hypothetical protein
MSVLEALADRLNSASVAVTATNLFIGLMPDTPDACVAIYEYAGAPPMEVFRSNDATLEQPSIQVMTRAGRNDYPTARALIESVRDTLTAITDETISGVRFLRVTNQSAINALGTDDKDRPEFSLALRAVVER